MRARLSAAIKRRTSGLWLPPCSNYTKIGRGLVVPKALTSQSLGGCLNGRFCQPVAGDDAIAWPD